MADKFPYQSHTIVQSPRHAGDTRKNTAKRSVLIILVGGYHGAVYLYQEYQITGNLQGILAFSIPFSGRPTSPNHQKSTSFLYMCIKFTQK
jgi:hypothetical protein